MQIIGNSLKALYKLIGYTYFRTVAESVEPTAELIRQAQRTLHILSGDLPPALWGQQAVKDALTKVANHPNPPEIEIIFGPQDSADPEVLAFLKSLARQGKLALYATNPRSTGHFIVADGVNVKIEDPHAPNDPNGSGYTTYGDERLGRALEARFSFVKQCATLLSS
jgi:hypothetical protein